MIKPVKIMSSVNIPEVRLNDGGVMPAIGFGTYKLNGSNGVEAIVSAIRAGYRLLDSAFKYENEGAVGEALRQSGIPRSEVQITSKLPGRRQHFEEVIPTIEESLYRAQLEYYDYYFIHWPNPGQGLYVEAWQGLVEARKRGLVKTIGVSNFMPEYTQKLIDETGVAPAVNQIEMHPYFPQKQQREWDSEHGIVTQSWSPLGRAGGVMKESILRSLADKYRKSVAQIVLRWHHQLGAVPVPKATSMERQLENMAIFDFELTAEEVGFITDLGRPDGRRKDQNPVYYEEL